MEWQSEERSDRMQLEQLWKKYGGIHFDVDVLPKEIVEQGKKMVFHKGEEIVSQGELLKYIYFIKSGQTIGGRNYEDGNEYKYFRIEYDKVNGGIGLLELLAQRDKYVASIICETDVEILRISAEAIYEVVMNNPEMLRRCVLIIAKDLYECSAREGDLYYLSGVNRLRNYLIRYFEINDMGSDKVVVREEYQDIAKQIGVSVRTVGRSIQKLKQSGEILSISKKVVLTKEKINMLKQNLK